MLFYIKNTMFVIILLSIFETIENTESAVLYAPDIISATDVNNIQIINNSITSSPSITFEFLKADSNQDSIQKNSILSCYLDETIVKFPCKSPLSFNNLNLGYHKFTIYNIFIVDINSTGTINSTISSNPITFIWNIH